MARTDGSSAEVRYDLALRSMPLESLRTPQSMSMLAGAAVGAILALAWPRHAYNPGLFLSIVTCAWLAIGLYALIRGEVTLRARGAKSSRTLIGAPARLAGVAIIALDILFTVVMSRATH